MRVSKDFMLLVVIFSSILAGVLFPTFGSIFQPYPLYCMMLLLFLSFLSIRVSTIWQTIRAEVRPIFSLLLFKLVLLPIGVFYLFDIVLPDYSLASLLLSGVSSGVVSPFFSQLMGGNSSLVLVMVVVTSVLTPFTLPTLVHFLVGRTVEISLLSMVKLLAMVIFLPLLSVEVFRRTAPDALESLLSKRYPLSLVLFSITNLGIFSRYADFFRHTPSTVLIAVLVSVALAFIYFLAGMVVSWGRPLEDKLAVIISLGLMNNVLVIVFSSELFGPVESMVAAMYTIPFFGLMVPVRAYRNYRLKRQQR